MTKDQINIAIHKLLGWKWLSFWYCDQDESTNRCAGKGKGKGDFDALSPDGQYHNLKPLTWEQIMQAQAKIPEGKRCLFVSALFDVCDTENKFACLSTDEAWILANADIDQRAEAICRTLYPNRFK